jgi:hypothetical protein
MDNDASAYSRLLWNFAVKGYIAQIPAAERPAPEDDAIFTAYVRGTASHQKWRHLKAFIRQESEGMECITYRRILHQLRDSRMMSRIQRMSLEEGAAELNRAAFAKKELAQAFKAFQKLLGGSDETRRKDRGPDKVGGDRPTNRDALPGEVKAAVQPSEGANGPDQPEEGTSKAGTTGAVRRRRRAGKGEGSGSSASEVKNA